MEPRVAAKLAALRQSQIPFPLESLLRIYAKYKSNNPLYTNYFEGFKLLVDWLSPLEVPDIQRMDIPPCFHTYEVQEIASILKLDQALIYTIFWRIHYATCNRSTNTEPIVLIPRYFT